MKIVNGIVRSEFFSLNNVLYESRRYRTWSVKGLEQLLVIPSFARDKRARDDHAVRVRRKEHDTVFRLNRLNNVITNNEHVI